MDAPITTAQPHPFISSTLSHTIMNAYRILVSIAALAITALSSCQQTKNDEFGADPNFDSDAYQDFANVTPLPQRNESISFYGPGSERLDKSMFGPVYFTYDSFSISAAEGAKLEQMAAKLRSNRKYLIIAGHTDAAGTSEYNRALGERRAQSVRSTLLAMGVAANRMQTVSFGEDSPAQPGNANANRRAEFGAYD